ncbi:hypothetical protein Mgra_00009580, partial [Meloidogyne graminicola]
LFQRFLHLNNSNIASYIEEDIHKLAKIENFKIKPMEVQQPNKLKNYSNKRGKRAVILSPISFSPLIWTLNNLNPVILSPAIFSPLILAPSILGPIILSPWLFVPLILTPRLLTPLILSPAALLYGTNDYCISFLAATIERFFLTSNSRYIRVIQRNRKWVILFAILMGILSKVTICLEFKGNQYLIILI